LRKNAEKKAKIGVGYQTAGKDRGEGASGAVYNRDFMTAEKDLGGRRSAKKKCSLNLYAEHK